MSDQAGSAGIPRRSANRSALVMLPTGGRLLVLVGLLLAVFAGYLLLSPITRVDSDGKAIDCGSLLYPPTDPFVIGLCGSVGDARLAQTVAIGVAALLVIAAAPVVFPSRKA